MGVADGHLFDRMGVDSSEDSTVLDSPASEELTPNQPRLQVFVFIA